MPYTFEPEGYLLQPTEICVGMQFLTRNGSIGNCVVTGVRMKTYGDYLAPESSVTVMVFDILTDFGNKVTMTFRELEVAYFLDKDLYFVCDLEERLNTQILLLTEAMTELQETK